MIPNRSSLSISADYRHATRVFATNIVISTVFLGLAFVYLSSSNNYLRVAESWLTPPVLLVLGAEFTKYFLNRFIFKLKMTQGSSRNQRVEFAFVRQMLKNVLLIFTSVHCFMFCAILLGAPILSNLAQTYALSTLLTIITLIPFLLVLGLDGTIRKLLFNECEMSSPAIEAVYGLSKYNAICGILGAWVASVVAPLDWDRPWQVYPIPNMLGALAGYTLSNLYGLLITLCGRTYADVRNKHST